MTLEVHWYGGMPLPLAPGGPDALPGLPAMAPARMTLYVTTQLTYNVASQQFSVTYTHPRPIVRLVKGEAVVQRPVAWHSGEGVLALTVKLLLAGLAAGGDGDPRPFFIVEDIVLRGAVGPALAVECSDPSATLSNLNIHSQDARRVKGVLTLSPWTCTVTVPAQVSVHWQEPPASHSPP